jgi:hypothetical protein
VLESPNRAANFMREDARPGASTLVPPDLTITSSRRNADAGSLRPDQPAEQQPCAQYHGAKDEPDRRRQRGTADRRVVRSSQRHPPTEKGAPDRTNRSRCRLARARVARLPGFGPPRGSIEVSFDLSAVSNVYLEQVRRDLVGDLPGSRTRRKVR